MPGAPRFAFHPLPGRAFIEVPVTTVEVMGRRFPCGGGGYFRLLPYALSRWAMARVNADGGACIFYFHPWEIDPGQPHQGNAPLKSRLRHYTNLGRMKAKLAQALQDFAWGRADDIFLAA
jgi:polysaccharide deacetylase family protein (PEP-CTERM system associated)